LLVYPEYPDTFWSFKHFLKFIAKKAAFPPLGLLTVAAMLPAGWRLGIVSKARFRYWQLIVKTFFVKRRALPIAMELAIHGFHFKKVMKQVCRS